MHLPALANLKNQFLYNRYMCYYVSISNYSRCHQSVSLVFMSFCMSFGKEAIIFCCYDLQIQILTYSLQISKFFQQYFNIV